MSINLHLGLISLIFFFTSKYLFVNKSRQKIINRRLEKNEEILKIWRNLEYEKMKMIMEEIIENRKKEV